jgi:hypothetical protein
MIFADWRVLGEANFRELRKAEVQLRRIYLPRTRVNKGQDPMPNEVSQPPLLASALRRLVGEIENTCAEDPRVDELHRLLIAPVLKETLSASPDRLSPS